MKSTSPDFKHAPLVGLKSTPTAPKPMRTEFRVGLYKDETLDQDGHHTAKTVGCSWACYCPGLGSITCLTNGFSYSYEKFRGCQSKCLGVFQILIGIMCIAANIAGIVMGAKYLNIAQGIWGGFLIAIAGSFGLAAGKRKSKCTIIGYTLWTMTAAGAAAAIIALTVIGTVDMVREHGYEVREVENCLEFMQNFTTTTTTITTTTTTTQRPSIATDQGSWFRPSEYRYNQRHEWSGGNNYDWEYRNNLQRYESCKYKLQYYVEDNLYYEKLGASVVLVVLSGIVELLFLWSFIICLRPFSCNCRRDLESSDSEATGLPQYTGYTVCSKPYASDVPPYQSVNESPINRPDLAVIHTGDNSMEKLSLTDHA